MGKRRKIILISLALILTVYFTSYLTRPNEPVYQGKTLTQWLESSVRNSIGDSAFPSPVLPGGDDNHAIQAIGTNGIPRLLELLQARDLPGAKPLENIVQGLGWKSFRTASAEGKHDLALQGFYMLGTNANSAAPALYQLLETGSPDTKRRCLDCLRWIKPPKEATLHF